MKILLLHGMGRTPLSMLPLRLRLSQAGYKPLLMAYWPAKQTLQQATRKLINMISKHAIGESYALIGHSLGSVIIRNAVMELNENKPAACFFLAPPITSSRAAKYFSKNRIYKILTGEMGQLLAQDEFMRALPVPNNTTIYAGTGGPRKKYLPFGMEANDGIVSVSEASGDGQARIVKINAIHTLIMNAKTVWDDILQTLEQLPDCNANNSR